METLKNSKKQSTRNAIARKEKISNSKIYVHEKEKKTGRKRKIVASICHHKRRKKCLLKYMATTPTRWEKKEIQYIEKLGRKKKKLFRRVRFKRRFLSISVGNSSFEKTRQRYRKNLYIRHLYSSAMYEKEI